MGTPPVQYKTVWQFSSEECRLYFNTLELKAKNFGLKALCKNEFNTHILVQIDKFHINKMGSVKSIEMNNEVDLYENLLLGHTKNDRLQPISPEYLIEILTENLDSRNLEQSICLIVGIFVILKHSLMSLHLLTCLH